VSIDWDATGSMLQGWGALGIVAAIVFAAVKGTQTYEHWRSQKVAERRQGQAERILTAAYRAKDALQHCRSGVIWGYELDSAKAKLTENAGQWEMQDEAKKRRLAKAQALLNRRSRHQEAIDELIACLPFAKAHFGDDLEKAVSALQRQFWIFQVDVESYVDDSGQDAEFTRKVMIGIGDRRADAGETDEIGDAVEKHCKKIDEICLPALNLET
jgi:hypothetical protein